MEAIMETAEEKKGVEKVDFMLQASKELNTEFIQLE